MATHRQRDIVSDFFFGGVGEKSSGVGGDVLNRAVAVGVLLVVVAAWSFALLHCIHKQMESKPLSDEERCEQRHMYWWQRSNGKRWSLFVMFTFVLLIAGCSVYHHHGSGALGIGLLKWAVILYVIGVVPCISSTSSGEPIIEGPDGRPTCAPVKNSVKWANIGIISTFAASLLLLLLAGFVYIKHNHQALMTVFGGSNTSDSPPSSSSSSSSLNNQPVLGVPVKKIETTYLNNSLSNMVQSNVSPSPLSPSLKVMRTSGLNP